MNCLHTYLHKSLNFIYNEIGVHWVLTSILQKDLRISMFFIFWIMVLSLKRAFSSNLKYKDLGYGTSSDNVESICVISIFLSFILWSIHLISSFSQFFSKESVFYTFLVDFCFYTIQKLKLCPYRLFWQILFWHQKSWCLTTFFPVVTEDFSIYVFNIFFLVASPTVNPQVRIDVEFFQNHGGWTQRLETSSKCFGTSLASASFTRSIFSHTFLLFSFWGSCWRSGMNYSGENMKVEHKKQKVERRLLIIWTFPHAFVKSRGSYS